jgi:TP901 family phage tail tape measure protein
MAEKELAIVARGRNLVSKVLKPIAGDLRSIEKSAGRAGRAGVRGLSLIGGAAAAAAVAGLGGSLKVAGDFEAALRTINTVAAVNDDALRGIGESIRRVARESGTPLDELTQGYYDLVSAGIAAKDANNVLLNANRLAVGGLGTTAETVDLLTTAINSYGGDASQATKITDIFAKAIERGKVTAADLAASFAQIGAIAAASGIEIEELGAAYAQLTAAGVPATEASTQMRAAIIALQRPTSYLQKLQKKLNVDFLKMARDKGLVVAYERLRKEADKAGIPLIRLTGRVEGTMFALQTTGPNLQKFNKNLREMGGAAGTAQRQMEERQQGLNFQLKRMKALAKDTGITIGTALLPTMTRLIDKGNKFLADPAVQKRVEEFGRELAGHAERISARLEKVDWGGIAEGLKIGGQGAKAIASAFMGLPPGIQAFLATGFVANKFSGGMLGTAISEIGKGVKGVLGMTAGVVNIKAGAVTGVGGGVGGGVGPAAGGAAAATASRGARLATAAVKVIGVVTVAGVAAELKEPIDGLASDIRTSLGTDKWSTGVAEGIRKSPLAHNFDVLNTLLSTGVDFQGRGTGLLGNIQQNTSAALSEQERQDRQTGGWQARQDAAALAALATARAAKEEQAQRMSVAARHLHEIQNFSQLTSIQSPAAASEAGQRVAAAVRLANAGISSTVATHGSQQTAAVRAARTAIERKRLEVNIGPTNVYTQLYIDSDVVARKVYRVGGRQVA